MAKYTSGRQKNLKVGIPSYSEDLTSLEVIGKVGIGTTNATANLQVDGSVILGSNSSDLINIPGSISSNLYPDGDGVHDVGRAPQIGSGANRWKDANFTGKGVFDSGVDAHNIEIGVGVANLIYSTSGNLELNAQSGITNIDDIVTISGNVGIGTTNPTSKLWVQGDGYFSGVITANSFIGDGSQLTGIATPGSISVSISPNIDDVFQYVPYATSFGSTTGFGATTLLVYNPSYGNLGIGTTNPTSKLSVEGDGYFSGVVTANSFRGDGSQLTGIVTSGTSLVSISTNNTDINQYVTYVTSFGSTTGFGATTALVYNPFSGNLGIGTVNPTSKLSVEGDGYFTGVVTANSFIGDGSQLTGIVTSGSGSVSISTNTTDANQYVPYATSIGTVLGFGATTALIYNPFTGNLGIGTTNPTSKLSVEGDTYVSGISTLSKLILTANGGPTSPQLQFTGSNSAWIDFGQIGVGTPTFTTRSSGTKLVLWNRVDASNVDYAFGISSGPDTLWSSVSSNFARFGWYAGTVGIATLYGEGNLDIVGIVSASSFRPKSGYIQAPDGTNSFYIYNSTGNVAFQGTIGVSQINSSAGYSAITFSSSSTTPTVDIVNNLNVSGVTSTNSLSIGSTQVISSSRELQNIASLDATTIATIESAIVNAPNTFDDIQVTGLSTFTNGPVLIGTGTSTGTTPQALQVESGAYFSGNLGIGTTNPTSKLQVEGDVFVSGILTATDINSASDINLKKNIRPFENSLDKVIQINGVTFEWKKTNSQSAGIIAQDVEKVFPELVRDGDFKTVNYNGLIGVLVESIKELKQEIEDLKRKIERQ